MSYTKPGSCSYYGILVKSVLVPIPIDTYLYCLIYEIDGIALFIDLFTSLLCYAIPL